MPSNRRKIRPEPPPTDRKLLDPVDVRLLEEILRAPRITLTQLGKALGLSRPSVTDRLGRLEREGVIARWRVELSPSALGLPYTVFVRIRPNGGQSDAIESAVRSTPAVDECYRTTGDDSYLLKMHVATIPEFEEVINRLRRFGQAIAVDVLSTVVAPRGPPLRSASGTTEANETDVT